MTRELLRIVLNDDGEVQMILTPWGPAVDSPRKARKFAKDVEMLLTRILGPGALQATRHATSGEVEVARVAMNDDGTTTVDMNIVAGEAATVEFSKLLLDRIFRSFDPDISRDFRILNGLDRNVH